MSVLKSTILVLLPGFILSCKGVTHNYPGSITNAQGVPNDSLQFYFTTYEPFDSSETELLKDTFLLDYVSASLYAFREPILSNGYLGKEQFRFLWLPSFHKPMVFVISKEHGQITLTNKTLDRHPLTKDVRYEHGYEWDKDYSGSGHELIIEYDTLENGRVTEMTLVKGRYAKIASNEKKVLTIGDWEKFKKLLSQADFWNLQTYVEDGSTDGAFWAIEANTEAGYKLVFRHTPEDKLMQLGQFLADKSGIKIKLY